MDTINVKETRNQFKALLNRVATGEEIAIQHRGKDVAKPVLTLKAVERFLSLKSFRASISVPDVPLNAIVLQNLEKNGINRCMSIPTSLSPILLLSRVNQSSSRKAITETYKPHGQYFNRAKIRERGIEEAQTQRIVGQFQIHL